MAGVAGLQIAGIEGKGRVVGVVVRVGMDDSTVSVGWRDREEEGVR